MFLLFSLLCYSVVLEGPFFFDDHSLIQHNPTVHSLKNIPEIYSTQTLHDIGTRENFYRPNRQLVFAFIYSITGGESTLLFHLVSILIHGLNGYLLFLLILKLVGKERVALVTSLLFLLHPLQTQAVAYISGLGDPLGFFWVLLGLHQYVKLISLERNHYYSKHLGNSLFCFVVALFCKESSVVFLPLLLLITLYFQSKKELSLGAFLLSANSRKICLSIFLYTLLLTGFLIFRFSLFDTRESFRHFQAATPYTEHLWTRLWSFIHILWEYFSLLFYPKDLFFEKPFLITLPSTISLEGVFGILLICSLILSLFFYQKTGALSFGLGWFFFALIPYMGFIPINAVFLEHWLYVPSIGIFFLLALVFDKFSRGKGKAFLYGLFLIVCLLLIGRTMDRNLDWADEERFYRNELKFAPESSRILNNLGSYYAKKRDYNKAILHFQKAKIKGNSAEAYYNLALLYMDRIQMNQAEEAQWVNQALHELFLGLQINSNHYYSLNLVHKIYQKYGQVERTAKVAHLLQNLTNGGRNSLHKIIDAMKNRDYEQQ